MTVYHNSQNTDCLRYKYTLLSIPQSSRTTSSLNSCSPENQHPPQISVLEVIAYQQSRENAKGPYSVKLLIVLHFRNHFSNV